MNNTHQMNRQSVGYVTTQSPKYLLGVLTLVVASVANYAWAQSSVQFGISESARLLEASIDLQRGDISQAEFNSIQIAETCKDPSTRLQNRNRPWLVVWNTTDTNTPDDVTTVTIDLTEPGFEFGDGDIAGDGFEGLLSMLSGRSDTGVSLSSVTQGGDDSELVLGFSGLFAGMAAIFRIDLDEPGGITTFPDFREAMLGADVGDGPGQLATLSTDFSSGAMTVSAFGMASPLSTSGIAEAYHGQTTSMVETSTTIPEPTSLLLLLAGLMGIATRRHYR